MKASSAPSTVLGFDTATKDVAIAVVRGGEGLSEQRLDAHGDAGPRHAATVLAAIESAAAEAGGWQLIDLIAVGVGPGAFTGLRVGVATARALAQGLDKPIVGVGSLAALSRGIGERPAARGRLRLAAIDARRGQAFAALSDPDGGPLWEPFVAAPEAIAERLAELDRPPLAAGDGSLRFRATLEAAGAEVLPDGDPGHRLAARHVCALATGLAPGRPEQIEPIYLRPPDAELWRERDSSRRTDSTV